MAMNSAPAPALDQIFPSQHHGDDEEARSLLRAEVRKEVLAGGDVLTVSQTPAKERTLAYLEPCYELLGERYVNEPRLLSVLVLVPTREMAVQVREKADKLGKAGGFKVVSCFHGVVSAPALTFNMANCPVTVLIATPSKLKDLINSGQVDLSHVFYLVLDGADRMVKMGLEPQVRDIIERVPNKRQSLMFSEILDSDVKKLAKDVLSNPRKLQLSTNQSHQIERRAVKRTAGTSEGGEKSKSKMILSGAEAEAAGRAGDWVSSSASVQGQGSAEEKEKCLAYFDLCSVRKAQEISAAMEISESQVVVRMLRSGVKMAPLASIQSYPTSQVKSKGKKLNKSTPVSPGPSRDSRDNLVDSPGKFQFGVKFTRKFNVSESIGWVFNYRYKRLYVDINSWVSVLFYMKNFSNSQLQVRVMAVLQSDNLTSSSTSYPPFHLIRVAEASLASYQEDSQGRHSVIFPVSSASTCRRFQFTKLSSDLGSEVKLVLSLEDGQGQEVGRRVFSVKIRAGAENV